MNKPRTFTTFDTLAIAREYFPDASDTELTIIIWEHTGYPVFWTGDPETCFRQQLIAFRDGKDNEDDTLSA